MSDAAPRRLRDRLDPGVLVAVVVSALLAVAWWSTAVSTSMARIAALQPVEAYAFAVYHQIVHNLAFDGVFFQTIHKGYDDAWTWSGHRAPALFTTAALYRLDPSAFGLARVQILQVLLGVLPAMLLGRRAAGGRPAGLLLGAAAYLGTPAVLAMALQDYQDLVLAVPFLTALAWALRAGHWAWVLPGVALGLLPREETVPLVVAMAVVVVPWGEGAGWRDAVRWRRWGLNVALCGGLAAAYGFGVEAAFPATETAYQMPLANAVGGMGAGSGVVFLDGWPFFDRFYVDLLLPLGVLGLLAPLPLVPAAGLVLFHLAIPVGHGIDRSWGGHCHHLAPAVPFLVVASIEGAGRLLRWLGRVPGPRAVAAGLVVGAALGLGGWTVARDRAWASEQNLRVTALPKNPAWVHPAWGLAEKLPADAVPAVPKDLAPVVAARRVSYTYDGSLESKARAGGLGAATHALVDTRQAGVEERVRAMAGATLVAEDGPFRLYTWSAGATDPAWPPQQGAQIRKARPYLGAARRRDDLPGVPPFESSRVPEGSPPPPALRLPGW